MYLFLTARSRNETSEVLSRKKCRAHRQRSASGTYISLQIQPYLRRYGSKPNFGVVYEAIDKNTCRSGKSSNLWNCKPHLSVI